MASRNGSNPDLPIAREIKLERGDRVVNQEGNTLSNGVAHMESDEGAGPSSSVQQYPNIDEVQKQQDKLVELMQETAQERDALKEQLKLLTSQLEDMQSRLQKQSQAKLDILEEEKSTLAVQCEELKLRMEQQKENAQSSARSPTTGTNTDDWNLNLSGSCFSSIPLSGCVFSLIELRQNVGRLLVSRVPALDLAQVNFECNVIDEILEQVLAEISSHRDVSQ
uniref:Uncharacterized protein n=1 Tax=Xiphophorus couchianus TaxID=32473 RepID=A0A3B5MVU2_9TELE